MDDKEYLQVVRYIKLEDRYKTKVVRSFGRNNLENRFKAEKYASNYNLLEKLLKKYGLNEDSRILAFSYFGFLGINQIKNIFQNLDP
ncbi:hypothetical protein AKJ59_00650 [candidate division MSBL1 archaeon SCGC-AAA385M02]|uniref:Uncharacterized protein n=1 Tax=candidate division MSBL1 archaeon SCGC-AAA385M02 TaxID=1698287 RepID=A0A133VQG4_9EURY|nr:hypothetical protein AKJ59_00650 [candidate division MSBL1 archaeon SCGC-AAA385M02]